MVCRFTRLNGRGVVWQLERAVTTGPYRLIRLKIQRSGPMNVTNSNVPSCSRGPKHGYYARAVERPEA
jgi:hypothetical protein